MEMEEIRNHQPIKQVDAEQSVIFSTPESNAAEENELPDQDQCDFQRDSIAVGKSEEASQIADGVPQPAEQTKPETSGKKLVHFSAKVKEIQACREEDLGSYSDESESGETSRLRALIKEAEAEFRDLSIENEVLQKRLLAVIKRRPTFDSELSMEGVEYQYWMCLKKWNEAKEELHMLQDDYDEEIDKAEDLLQDKQEERNNLHTEFSNYKWQVAREAKHRTLKKHLSRNFLEQLQLDESKVDEEIEKLRLELRRLSIELRHHQRAIARKDKLPNGLSTTDFEHLRSLNVSLSTKLTSKKHELAEFVIKAKHVIHALTHCREKLQFVQGKTKADAKALELIDVELNDKRLELHKIIESCHGLHLKRSRMQSNVLNVRDSGFLNDMETFKDEGEILEGKLDNIKRQHERLMTHIQSLQHMILKKASAYLSGMAEKASNNRNHLRWGVKKVMNPMVAASH